MNLGAIISAVPWLRRVWKLMPGPLRIPVLVVAAAVGIWYAVTGRKQLLDQQRDDGPGDAGSGSGEDPDGGPASGPNGGPGSDPDGGR